MKRNIILGGVAALALGAVAGGVAIAQQAPERPQMAERVSRADFVAQRVARMTAQDANRDGTVTADERRAAHEARRAERVADRFAKLDTNGDGSLSRAEFEAGHAMRGERMGRRGPGGPGGPRPERVDRAGRTMTVADGQARAERAFDRLDKDRDGYVTREERQDGRRGHRGGRGPHGPADMATPPAPGS